MDTSDDDAGQQGSWGQLLSGRNLPVIVVLAGGVALYAINVYLASSLLPSAVGEIGGQRLYAWNTTVFLLASVGSSVLVNRLLRAVSRRGAYLVALSLFVAGTVICLAAPSMIVLLVGRAVQGAGGGLLAGQAYGLIQSVLPERLWGRAIAITSAMWGVGTLVGPAIGGALAEFASWRGAFAALAAAAVALGLVVPHALGGGRPDTAPEAVPVVSLVLVMAAALVVSVVSVVGTPLLSAIGVLIGVVLVAGFVGHERRTRGPRVFPVGMFLAGSPLRWFYATLALLAIGSQVEGFVPLFGQRLAGLAPLAAAFLGAASAAGWTIGQISSSNATGQRSTRRLTMAGPVTLTVGLVAAALTLTPRVEGWALAAWVVALLVAGAGIGLAWPHLSTNVMSTGTRTDDGTKAAAAINTVQLLANAFGAALTGVLVNLAANPLASARYLFVGIAIVTALGVLTVLTATHRHGHSDRTPPTVASAPPRMAKPIDDEIGPDLTPPHQHTSACYWDHERAAWSCGRKHDTPQRRPSGR